MSIDLGAVTTRVPSPLNGEKIRVRGGAARGYGVAHCCIPFPPLTPALSPLRGEGEGIALRSTLAARFRQWAWLVLVSFCFSASALEISWTNNLLTVTGTNLPGGKLEIWYLEAFCRSGAHTQAWGKTTIPHKTTLLTNENNRVLRFRTTVQSEMEVNHVVTSGDDELDIRFTMTNRGKEDVNAQWFQPACIRVEKFTGCVQSNYTAKSFIFTERGLTTLDQTRRTEEALYRGGQVYVMPGVSPNDANPRPLCLDRPTNGLIGCFSADGRQLLATASDQTHELFEGVYVCLHSDPRIGGLKAGETKTIRAKVYVLTNDVPALLRRYERDIGVR